MAALLMCCTSSPPPTIGTTGPFVPTPSPSSTPAPTVATQTPTGSANASGLLEFHAPPPLSGDWAFAIRAGMGVSGGHAVPGVGELWAIPLAGAPATLIARYVDWSDGSELRANILRRQLSADGKRLVLSGAGANGRYVLSLIDLGAGKVTIAAQDPAADLIRPALSPDGTKVAYVRKAADRDDGLWLVNADGASARQLRPGVDGLYTWTYGWTPDSRFLAFDQVGSAPSYVLIDVATGARTSALGFANILWGEPAAWRAKTPSLAAGLADRGFDGEYRLVVADRADASQRVLVDESNHHLILDSPRWNPTSDEILYRRLISVIRSEFYVVPASGGVPTLVPLAQHPWLADWTPDGTGVVYIAQDTGGYSWLGVGVRLARRDGTADRELLAMPDGALSDLLAVRYPG